MTVPVRVTDPESPDASPPTLPRPPDEELSVAPANLVRLRGKVTTAAEERSLPSGTVIVTFRLSVGREPSPMTRASRQQVDWVDCSVWGGRVRRSALRWSVGDVVELEGALRRRFYRGAGGTATRLEVEVLSGRVVARAARPPKGQHGTSPVAGAEAATG